MRNPIDHPDAQRCVEALLRDYRAMSAHVQAEFRRRLWNEAGELWDAEAPREAAGGTRDEGN